MWKNQQKLLWSAVREATKHGKDRFKISELFADERCTQAVLGFQGTTDVGRTMPPREGEEEEGSEKRTRGAAYTDGERRRTVGERLGRGVDTYLDQD